MSQSPLNEQDDETLNDYQSGWLATYGLLRSGRSWSGSERNCAFLNCGTDKFACVSSVTGLDFPDDARGVVSVDWDHDGDLDFWLSNRTSPRLRLMRNDIQNRNGFIAIKLQGTRSNRDGIGARLELQISGSEQRPLVKTLYAGNGFASQSSKWVHFGLGKEAQIEQLLVRWPSGDLQRVTGLESGRRYTIVEGQHEAIGWALLDRNINLSPSVQTEIEHTDAARIVLPKKIPLPLLRYKQFGEGPEQLIDTRGEPLLVNLWASWCAPCAVELKQWTDHHSALEELDLNILALTVDGLAQEHATGPEDAQRLLEQINFKFETGIATPELLDKLELIHSYTFDRIPPMAIPLSYLLDREGQLSAIYLGPFEFEDLLRDVRNLDALPDQIRELGSPMSGRYYSEVQPPYMPFMAQLFENRYKEDFIRFLDIAIEQDESQRKEIDNKKLRRASDEFRANMIMVLAEAQVQEQRLDDAVYNYRRLLQLQPDDRLARFNLGNTLVKQGKLDESVECFRLLLDRFPNYVNGLNNLGSVLERSGKQQEAIEYYQKAIEVDPEYFEARYNLARIHQSQGRFEEAIAHYRISTQIKPEDFRARLALAATLASAGQDANAIKLYRELIHIQPEVGKIQFQLATLLFVQGDLAEALPHFREAVRLSPRSVQALNALAWILATCPNERMRQPTEALQLAQRAVDMTSHSDPMMLDTLAAAHAAVGQFDQAVATVQTSLNLAIESGNDDLAKAIQARLEMYRNQEPFVDPTVP